MFMCGSGTSIPHQIGFVRFDRDDLLRAKRLNVPDKIIDFFGHIIGYAMSPDERYLYVNVRPWPDNAVPTLEQPPAIASQVELRGTKSLL